MRCRCSDVKGHFWGVSPIEKHCMHRIWGTLCKRVNVPKMDGPMLTIYTYLLRTSSEPDKGKGFPYLIPSVGPGADPGVQPAGDRKSSTRR